MRTKRIYTVVWTSDNDTDEVSRFLTLKEANDFAEGKRHYQTVPEPFCDEVPVHIAKRWGF